MKKVRAVDFSGEIPRVIVGYEGEASGAVLVNPSLSAVKNLPPHCWYLQDGKIVPGEPRNICTMDKAAAFVGAKSEKDSAYSPTIVKEVIKELQPQIFNNTIVKKEVPTSLYRLVFLHSVAIIAIIIWDIVR